MTEKIQSTTKVQEESVTEVSAEEPSLTVEEQALFNEMMNVGVFYGRSKSRTNPLMKKYVVATRSGFEILDLNKTINSLKKAADVLTKIVKGGGVLLLVGTSPAAKNVVRELGERLNVPYVSERWLGGTLTNFKTISKRISYFKKLKDDKASGKLGKYTKKEQLKIDRELAKLDKFFAGIESLERLPDVLFIADLIENEFAAKEAKMSNIPTVAILNTDADPRLVDYPIPGNDRSPQSIKLISEYLEKKINEAQKEAVKTQDADVAKKETEKNNPPEADAQK